MTSFLGSRLSPGIATGKAWVLKQQELFSADYAQGTPEEEKEKFLASLQKVDQNLQNLQNSPNKNPEEIQIIDAHRMFLQDPEWSEQILSLIQIKQSAPQAVHTVTTQFAEMMAALEDVYMKERAQDIRDVGAQILRALQGIEEQGLLPSQGEFVVVTHEMTPSQFSAIDKKRILGLVTEVGGVTSHIAIMARLYGIPTVSNIEFATDKIKNSDHLCIHADKSQVFVNPAEKEKMQFEKLVADYKNIQKELSALKDLSAELKDGTQIHLEANIGSEADLTLVHDHKAEGIGLFRTEFLFFDRTQAPSEEEQYKTYLNVGKSLAPHPVVIRTFDIGADKQVPYLKWPKEDNPFLGLRALRYCLKEPALFHTQLRALLRASCETPLSIMFPMVSSVEELQLAKKELLFCEEQIKAKGLKPNYKLGIMIEVPAAALIAQQLAPLVDFFSIGTNDLIQYTCAVDRTNESVAHLYQSFHPGVLNLISQVITAGQQHKKDVAMCGEMAADLDLIPLLIGMGLRIFSQSPSTVSRSKHLIRKLNTQECEQLWNDVRNASECMTIQKKCEAFRDQFSK